MPKPTLEYLANLEKAIKEKYGIEAITNPKASWDIEKEQNYLQQIKEIYSIVPPEPEMVNNGGVSIAKKLFIKDNNRICVSCKVYSFNRKDDLYMNKFKCCFECYVEHVEYREEKWKTKLKELGFIE